MAAAAVREGLERLLIMDLHGKPASAASACGGNCHDNLRTACEGTDPCELT